MGARFHIRAATGTDVSAITAIERASFADPWSSGSLGALVRDPDVTTLVAVQHRRVIGYVYARAAGSEAEILDLAVGPDDRRCGVGRALVAAALEQLAAAGVCAVYLEVRDSNTGAQAFYRTLGFREVGRRPRYYRYPAEDAVVMALEVQAG